jgi:hypothetical protein
MQRLAAMEGLMLASPNQQISLTDPDSRSMATSGRGSGMVGYNVQIAVDTEHFDTAKTQLRHGRPNKKVSAIAGAMTSRRELTD